MINNPQLTVLVAFGLLVLIGGVNFVAVRFSNQELYPFWVQYRIREITQESSIKVFAQGTVTQQSNMWLK
ncbi:MAG: hypothetical protein Q8P92_00110 [Candidatus Daviesbacteria bacterium]|nr:hypothetical protein [Candidatus Daviesbacteria bacterium]